MKAARLTRGGTVVRCRTCSNTNNNPATYRTEIDAFGIWCPELQKAYLIPIEDTPSRGGHLRLTPTANQQNTGVRFAVDHEITPRE